MRYISVLLLLISFTSFAQQRTISGRVTDPDNVGIPFSIIQEKGRSVGVYADEHGKFTITINTDSAIALVVYCMGYERKEIPLATIGNEPMNIILKRTSLNLKEVAINSDKVKMQEGIIGKKNLKPFGVCTNKYGGESAIYLEADSTKHGYLKEVFVYITKDGIPDTKFRIHVYNVDTNDLPGKDITDSNVIVHGTTGDEWVRADLSARHIPIRGGVFISVEWVADHGNNPTLLHVHKYSDQQIFNGQVVSFTQSYWKLRSLMYSRDVMKGEWCYREFAGTLKRNVLNMMVYGTYIYKK